MIQMVIFEIQADAAFPVTDLAGNYDMSSTSAGDTTSGISGAEVGTGSTVRQLQTCQLKQSTFLKILRIAIHQLANTNVIVKINNHLFSAKTAA